MQRGNHKGLYGWDYTTRCFYMITLVASPRRPIFGICREWGIERTALAKAVYDAWQALPQAFPQVQASLYSIMPDHFHGILFVKETLPCGLDEVVCAFAEDCERRAGKTLWAEDYRESICLAKGQLARMNRYVMENPRRLWIKQNNKALFEKQLGLRHPRLVELGASIESEIWDLETRREIAKPRKGNRATAAFGEDLPPTFIAGWESSGGVFTATTGKGEKIAVKTAGFWTAMGNPFLLEEPMIVSVRISRWTPPGELAKIKARIASKAARGAVVAGAWINAFEREAKEAALAAGGRVISLMADGMGRYFKPHAGDMALCAEGRLLLLSPFAPRESGALERESRGKAHFEFLNAAAKALADAEIGWARPKN
ncbi:MAG: hypothetical protein II863_07930 [Kiritimatiellae bacterium]|nr:hypothetical protein [Kiritimatiellia bacterium]